MEIVPPVVPIATIRVMLSSDGRRVRAKPIQKAASVALTPRAFGRRGPRESAERARGQPPCTRAPAEHALFGMAPPPLIAMRWRSPDTSKVPSSPSPPGAAARYR